VKSLYPLEGARASILKGDFSGKPEVLFVECDEPPFAIHLSFETTDELHIWHGEMMCRVVALQRISGAHEVIESHKASAIDEKYFPTSYSL
jgi:hypothetical protein